MRDLLNHRVQGAKDALFSSFGLQPNDLAIYCHN